MLLRYTLSVSREVIQLRSGVVIKNFESQHELVKCGWGKEWVKCIHLFNCSQTLRHVENIFFKLCPVLLETNPEQTNDRRTQCSTLSVTFKTIDITYYQEFHHCSSFGWYAVHLIYFQWMICMKIKTSVLEQAFKLLPFCCQIENKLDPVIDRVSIKKVPTSRLKTRFMVCIVTRILHCEGWLIDWKPWNSDNVWFAHPKDFGKGSLAPGRWHSSTNF